jgi:hypothetical protein
MMRRRGGAAFSRCRGRRSGVPAGRGLALALSVAAALAGCGEGGDEEPASVEVSVSVSDSAGVTVLEIDWDAAPRLRAPAAEPEFILGDGDATGHPHGVVDATRLADGRVAFLDGATGQVVVADPPRSEARRHGRAGRGPDEFMGPMLVVDAAAGAGGLRVLDTGSWGWVAVDPDGGVGERVSLLDGVRSSALSAGWVPPGSGASGADGDLWLFVVTAAPIPTEPGESRPVGAVLRVPLSAPGSAGTMSAIDTVAYLPGPAFRMGPDYSGLVLMGSSGHVAAGPGGGWFGDSGSPRVRRSALGPEGGASTAPDVEIRWRTSRPLEITAAMRDGVIASMLEVASPEERDFLEENARSMVFADRLPHFESLVVGDDRRLWIGRHEADLGELALRTGTLRLSQEWLVVDVDQATAERVVLPAGFRLRRAGTDRVLGVMRDGQGVETVRSYLLERLP